MKFGGSGECQIEFAMGEKGAMLGIFHHVQSSAVERY